MSWMDIITIWKEESSILIRSVCVDVDYARLAGGY